MIVRDTSAQAYAENLASGLIEDLRLLVYTAVHDFPDLTANEISRLPQFSAYQIDSVRPRFAELRRVGIIAEGLERKDQHTGKLSITWRITSNVAQKIDFEPPKARTFWAVKRDACIGRMFTDRKQAEEWAKQTGLTVFKVREVK